MRFLSLLLSSLPQSARETRNERVVICFRTGVVAVIRQTRTVSARGCGACLGGPLARSTRFRYSDAVKSSHVVWDATTLDKWLQDPDSVVPDNDMSFRLENKAERTAIIEYLKGLNAH